MVRKPWTIALLLLAVAVASAIVIAIHTPDPGISPRPQSGNRTFLADNISMSSPTARPATPSRVARRWLAASGW